MSLPRYSLRQLHAFATVAETLGFAAAARRIGLTPSAVSQLVVDLESEVGFRLFDRSTRHVELSAAGREFLGPAPQSMSRLKGKYRWHLTLKGRDHRRLHAVARPQHHQHRHQRADELDRGVHGGEARRHEQDQRDPEAGALRHRGCWMRFFSSSHTGVSWPGSSGRAPRSVWLSSGLWKSLPREAARPYSCATSA